MRDPYTILGISSAADAQTVRRAYKKLAVQFHPDRNPAADAASRFKEVAAAYAVLTNERERKRYARQRHREHAEREQQQRQQTAERARQRAAAQKSASAAAAEQAFWEYARQVKERRAQQQSTSTKTRTSSKATPGAATVDWRQRIESIFVAVLMATYVWRSIAGLPLQPWLTDGSFMTHAPGSPIWITLSLAALMVSRPKWFLIPLLVDGVRDIRLAGWAMLLMFPFISAGGVLGFFR